MPEGDTIFRAARAMHGALAGDTVTRFETAYAHLDRVAVDTPIVGRTIERVAAVGKHHLIVFSGDLILRTHMRMHGSWHLYRHGEKWWRSPRSMRIRLDTAKWVAVGFDVPVAAFVTGKELATTDAVAKLGPDLLAETFDRDEALRRLLAAAQQPIALSLLDQRVVAGVGNVYKSEILFLSGTNPYTPTTALGKETLERMLDLARELLHANVGDGGSAQIQTFRNLRRTNRSIDPSQNLWVYGRAGKPCRRCGAPIEASKMGVEARSTYWCNTCQPAVLRRSPADPPAAG
jgi:endonuclease-8